MTDVSEPQYPVGQRGQLRQPGPTAPGGSSDHQTELATLTEGHDRILRARRWMLRSLMFSAFALAGVSWAGSSASSAVFILAILALVFILAWIAVHVVGDRQVRRAMDAAERDLLMDVADRRRISE